MRALVSGGAGFIGSSLVRRLLADGWKVTVLDDLSTGRSEAIARLAGGSELAFHRGSAADPSLVARLIQGCDYVLHLAAAVGVRLIIDRPVETIETNVLATDVVLRAAAEREVPVLYTSTSEVYGKGTRAPFREDDDVNLGATDRSRWSYACSKALGEWLALAWHRKSGLSVVIARLFNTVGPGQTDRYGMVLPTFARQALLGEPITVFGDGRQTRCFAHVRDIVEAIRRLMGCPEAVGRVVNVGGTEEVSIAELARLVRAMAGSTSEIVHVPYEEAYIGGFEDMGRRVPDLTRLEKWTGFRPAMPLEAIVRDVVDSVRGELAGSSA